jgi:lipid-A-disaccharide synthase
VNNFDSVNKLEKVKKIAIITGEKSGDVLGAKLLEDIRNKYPDAYCYGIGGEDMKSKGFHNLASIDQLSLMGVVEVLGSIFKLIKLKNYLVQQFLADKPDVVIGIDAPDFNFRLYKPLKAAGITCIHYVSPKVWAWREHRIMEFKKKIDHMLTLFPFEVEYYSKYDIPATFVGHPYTDKIVNVVNQKQAKEKLKVPENKRVIAILPGSRNAEINRLGRLFIETASKLQATFTDLVFVIPAANSHIKTKIAEILKEFKQLDVILIEGQSELVLAASTAVIVASGTATLETALHKKPMVVSYKVNCFSYMIIKSLIKIPYVALPNILSKKFIVPELLQDKATCDNLYQEMHRILSDQQYSQDMISQLNNLYQELTNNDSNSAFKTIDKYLAYT